MPNSKPYDVVLIPEFKIADAAIEISENLKHFGTFFTLDNKTFFPHISLYMLQLKETDLQKVLDILDVIATETPTVRGVPKLFGSHDGYIDVEYEKTNEMQQIQMSVINALNPIRDGLRDKDKERILTSTEEEKEVILKYGYRSVDKYFEPHLTFTRFKNPQENISDALLDMKMFGGSFPEFGIYEMGDNGTCVREVRRWQLQ